MTSNGMTWVITFMLLLRSSSSSSRYSHNVGIWSLVVLIVFVVCVFQSLLRLALFPDVLSSRYNGVSPLLVAHEIEFVIRLSPMAQSIRWNR